MIATTNMKMKPMAMVIIYGSLLLLMMTMVPTVAARTTMGATTRIGSKARPIRDMGAPHGPISKDFWLEEVKQEADNLLQDWPEEPWQHMSMSMSIETSVPTLAPFVITTPPTIVTIPPVSTPPTIITVPPLPTISGPPTIVTIPPVVTTPPTIVTIPPVLSDVPSLVPLSDLPSIVPVLPPSYYTAIPSYVTTPPLPPISTPPSILTEPPVLTTTAPSLLTVPPVPTLTTPPVYVTAPPALLPSIVPPTYVPPVIFTCTETGVAVAEASAVNVSTAVSFRVTYVIETTVKPFRYLERVNELIVETAAVGALQCVLGGSTFSVNSTESPEITVMSVMTTQNCTPETAGSECVVWETSFEIAVDQDVEPTVASFLGYMFLEEEMNSGAFVDRIPILDRVKYLRPSPLLPPITGGDGPTEAPELGVEDDGELSVNRWTLGAVLAMCVGGAMALTVWARNRRTRNERHMQLMENVSVSSQERTQNIAARRSDV